MFGLHKVPSVDAASAHADAQAGTLVIVDVREPGEVAEAAVPGARHIPLGRLAARAEELPSDRRIGFLCRSGNRSAGATKAALEAGLDAVNVKGGIVAWERAGLPVEHRRHA